MPLSTPRHQRPVQQQGSRGARASMLGVAAGSVIRRCPGTTNMPRERYVLMCDSNASFGTRFEPRSCTGATYTPDFVMVSVALGLQIPSAVVHELLSTEEAARYDMYSLRSYVEDNRQMSWCTGKVRYCQCHMQLVHQSETTRTSEAPALLGLTHVKHASSESDMLDCITWECEMRHMFLDPLLTMGQVFNSCAEQVYITCRCLCDVCHDCH